MKPNRLQVRITRGLLLALVLAGSRGLAGETNAPAGAVPKPPEAPATHTLARPPARAKAQFDAVFEAVEMVPTKLEPKAWTDLTVLEVTPHGARVSKGDMLLRLETEKLEEQIEELERDRPAAQLARELAAAELQNLKQTTPLKIEAARRARRLAEEDLAYFEKTGREQKEKAAKYNVKAAEQRLDGAREELKQLDKMYKADDLVEDTEEIILRRQKFAVESAEYGLETSRQGVEYSLKTGLPREHESLQTSRRDQELALDLAGETLQRNLSKKRLDFAKLEHDQEKAEKRLADLKKDLKNLGRICASRDGVVYYGACEGGKWTTGAAMAKKLVPGGKLAPNEVLFTIVNPEKLALRAVVQESDLALLKPGLEGQAAPLAAPDQKLPVKLEEISRVPLPAGGFEARLSVRTDPKGQIMPGMNCKVSLGDPPKPEALRAPKEAVFTEGGASHVFVFKDGGPPEKRPVQTGAADDKTIELLQGVSDGEKILLKRPQ
jgi:HlyD family secretion protein